MTGFRRLHRVARQKRLAVAVGKRTVFGRAARAGLGVLVVALLLGTAPRDAGAQACRADGIKPKKECVTAGDIQTKKKGKKQVPVINQNWRKDEAGVAINQPPAGNQRVKVINGPVAKLPVFTTLKMKVPAAGWIVVTANAFIEGFVTQPNLDVNGVVDCEIKLAGPLFNVEVPVAVDFFFGVIDTGQGTPTDTMQNLYVRELGEVLFKGKKKGKDRVISVDLACGLVKTLGVSTNADGDERRQILMRPPSLVVQYFPTRYCRKKRDGTCR